MTYLYDFFIYQNQLFLDLWIEKQDGSVEYWGGLGVENIAEGYEILEKYKAGGATVKHG